MRAEWLKYVLQFDRERGTSRGWLSEKPSWFIILRDGEKIGIGECGLLPGLSFDDRQEYEAKLDALALAINQEKPLPDLTEWPSIKFGMEMAKLHIEKGSLSCLYSSDFTQNNQGIEINGLVWMGSKSVMLDELAQKLEVGFDCIKIKIGAIDFEEELSLLRYIREHYSASEVTIRVDANGAFNAKTALEKLNILSEFEIHSIEQPIRAGQWEDMARLCANSPIPIALDEELIGLCNTELRRKMLREIKPQAIVLKPSLVGGFQDCDEWIKLAQEIGAFWWITSALESNLGLNAIAQYTASKNPTIPQGLGTGGLYVNNIESPLEIIGNKLFYQLERDWVFPFLDESV
jgi:o-succinylbenzoate synthase